MRSAPAATTSHWAGVSPSSGVIRPALAVRSGTRAVASDNTIIGRLSFVSIDLRSLVSIDPRSLLSCVVSGFRLRGRLPPPLKLRRTTVALREGGRRTAVALPEAVSRTAPASTRAIFTGVGSPGSGAAGTGHGEAAEAPAGGG